MGDSIKVTIPKSLIAGDYMLALAEKPTAAKRIANALTAKPRKNIVKVYKNGKKLPDVDVYSCKTEEGKVLIVSALGHLFTLVQHGGGWQYPVYDYKWVPVPYSYSARRNITKHDLRIEAVIEALRALTKRNKQLIICTDLDQEGEVIGGVIFRELATKTQFHNIKRMRFSTLTVEEIQTAWKDIFANKQKIGLDYGLFEKGLMRHYLDWLWGINLSRALMLSLKNSTGRYKTLSTGRVQGPTLSFVAERQLLQDTFVPIPYFILAAKVRYNKKIYELTPRIQKITSKKKAMNLVTKNSQATAIVDSIECKQNKISRIVPYNLSSLQKDAYRFFKLSPKRTLNAAERLYLSAAISYPRTSSEKYAPKMEHSKIISDLMRQKKYKLLAQLTLREAKKRKPKQGTKEDPAHPAIAPTGQAPQNASEDAKKVYELIIKRYFATFGAEVKLEKTSATITIGEVKFSLSGSKIIKKGWWALFDHYIPKDLTLLPSFKTGDTLAVHSFAALEKLTSPPNSYNENSLLKKMEEAEIGTKATRADIIDTLIKREYISGSPLQVTKLGKIVYEVLKNYSPSVLSVDLSRDIEAMGELIERTRNDFASTNPLTLSDAIFKGIQILHTILLELKESEYEIGLAINRELLDQNREDIEICECPVCHEGTLRIIKGRSGKRFLGCSLFFDEKKCTATFPIPQKGKVVYYPKTCPIDGMPQLQIFSGKKPWVMCINPDCESRKEREKAFALKKVAVSKKKAVKQ